MEAQGIVPLAPSARPEPPAEPMEDQGPLRQPSVKSTEDSAAIQGSGPTEKALVGLISSGELQPAVVKAIEVQSGSTETDFMEFVLSRIGAQNVIENCSEFVKMLSVLMIAKQLKRTPVDKFPEHLNWVLRLLIAIDVREEQIGIHADGVLKQVHAHLESASERSDLSAAPLLLEELEHVKGELARVTDEVKNAKESRKQVVVLT